MYPPSSSSSQAESLLQQGIEASLNNDQPLAIKYFQLCAQAAPQAAQPHFLLASEFAASGQIDKAEQSFTNAVLLAPDVSLYRYQLGLLQFSSNRVSAALLTWSPLLELEHDSPYPNFVLGFIELSQDHFAHAREHFERGIAQNDLIPALSDDIEKILQGIDAAQSLEVRQEPESTEVTDDDAPNHLFLSNYQQEGRLH